MIMTFIHQTGRIVSNGHPAVSGAAIRLRLFCGSLFRPVARLSGSLLAAILMTGLVALPGMADRALAAGARHDAAPATDSERELVKLPAMMQQHMLGNMRDHLRALNEILTALGAGHYDEAAKIAEHRLGMSSLSAHGAQHMAPFMPAAMREIGTGMHKAASRFALKAQEAATAASGADQAKAAAGLFTALSEVTDHCVACHQGYRIH